MLKLKLNTEGDLSLEFVSHMLTFLILLVFIVEMTMIGFKHNLALNYAYKIAKTIAIQSGISAENPPTWYSEIRPRYVNLQDFKNSTKSYFIDTVGIESYQIEVIHKNGLGEVLETIDMNSTATGIKMNYNDLFDVRITYKINMNLINNVLLGDYSSNGSFAVSSICEYKDYLE